MHSKRKRVSQKVEELVKLNSQKTKKKGYSIRERISYLFFPGGYIVLSISLGVWLLILGCSNYQAAATFKNKAVATTGIITGTSNQSRTGSSGGFPSSYTVKVPTIQFETRQGETIRFTGDDDFCTKSCLGKKVQIFYASDNPHQAMVKGGSSPLDKVRIQIGLGIFMILAAIVTFIVTLTEYGKRFGSTRCS